MPGTNALAYYEKSYLTELKSFLTLAIGVGVMERFCSSLTAWFSKLVRLVKARYFLLGGGKGREEGKREGRGGEG